MARIVAAQGELRGCAPIGAQHATLKANTQPETQPVTQLHALSPYEDGRLAAQPATQLVRNRDATSAQPLGVQSCVGHTQRVSDLRSAFNVVTQAFRCSAEEIELAWTIALQDLDAADAVFHPDAAMIRAGWKPLEERAVTFAARVPLRTHRRPFAERSRSVALVDSRACNEDDTMTYSSEYFRRLTDDELREEPARLRGLIHSLGGEETLRLNADAAVRAEGGRYVEAFALANAEWWRRWGMSIPVADGDWWR